MQRVRFSHHSCGRVFVFSWIVAVVLGTAGFCAPVVQNSGFESGGNPPASWSEFDASSKAETIGGLYYEGWYSGGLKDIKQSGQGIYQVVSGFSPGTEYQVTCWFRSTWANAWEINGQVLIDKQGGTSVGGADASSAWMDGSSSWQQLSVTFTASQSTATIFLRASADWANYPYWCLFDYVQVTAIGGGGPTPTNTPGPPPATPTPSPTPYSGGGNPPPICPHLLGMNGDIWNWMQGAPWVKVLDQGLIAGAHASGCSVFFRPYGAGDEADCYDGAAYGQAVLNVLSNIPQYEWPEAIGYRNEFFNDDVTPYQFIPYYDTLRAGGYQGIICYGSYGVGWPDISHWDLPQVRAAVAKADAIETHEYFDLTVAYWDTWLAHRHVRAINTYPYLLGKPWFIGEMGSDRCGNEDPLLRRGWQDRGKISAPDFITQLGYYINGGPGSVPCADQVVACFIFQQGSGGWWDFEIMGTSVADWVKTTWSGYVPPPTNTPAPPPPTNTPVPPTPTNTPLPSGPIAQENFDSMPSWSSSFNASWGSAASWSIASGGSPGNYLRAIRSSGGSSAKVKVYNVPSYTTITISVKMRCPSMSNYWMESGYRLGSHSAQDFDQNSGAWTMIKKFDSYGGQNGNGNTWTNYSVQVNTGSSTQISIGYKLGSSGNGTSSVGWDTMKIE